ncbi:MAG: helix-turn-helix domain-containing protein [Porticoccaceae bacterium]
MATENSTSKRRNAVKELKRDIILAAARQVFEQEGLEGASLRAIAKAAGYTPAALYFHFDSKEAVYAELLSRSLDSLRLETERAIARSDNPADKMQSAAMAFFLYYRDNPGDLDLGFYLFRGGMKPHGLGKERDRQLNRELQHGLQPITDAAIALGASETKALEITVSLFAHATGLLLLSHTGRIRIFGVNAEAMMAQFAAELTAGITAGA